MKVLVRVFVTVFSLAFGFSAGPAQAYEYEHYALTYYLAVHLGYSERQAYQIASASFAIDWASETSPMPAGLTDELIALSAAADEDRFRRIWRDFHAFSSLDIIQAGRARGDSPAEIEAQTLAVKTARQDVLWEIGQFQENPGAYLHFSQDIQSHSGWADLYGHGPAGHLPDFPSASPQKFLLTAQVTVAALQRFYTETCANNDREYCDKPLRAPDWARIAVVLDRLIAANPLPAGIDYTAEFERDAKELTMLYSPVDSWILRIAQHNYCPPIGCTLIAAAIDKQGAKGLAGRMVFNAGTALAGLQGLLTYHGVEIDHWAFLTVSRWLTDLAGPEPNLSRLVIVKALAEERQTRANALDRLLLDEYDVKLIMPERWIQFDFARDGEIINDIPMLTKIEDIDYVIDPKFLDVEVEVITGADGKPVFRATVEFDLALDGIAPMENVRTMTTTFSETPQFENRDVRFMHEFPTIIQSEPGPNAAEQMTAILGRDGKMHFSHQTEFAGERYEGLYFYWKITLHGYGLQTKVIQIPVTLPDLEEEEPEPEPEPEPEDEPAVAACNSAVESGGNEGGHVTVDLAGFTGKAGFSYEMYDVFDQMDVNVGGLSLTTGCTNGAGTFEFEVPHGAATASITVIPNCQGTDHTGWNFTFECPLTSDVTADGNGNSFDDPESENEVVAGQIPPNASVPSAVGEAVTMAPPVPAHIGPTGVTIYETETGVGSVAATPVSLGDQVIGAINPLGDGDNYVFNATHQGELVVSFPSVPAGVNIGFRVLNSGGDQVWGWQTASDTGTAYSNWVDIATPGQYQIEVRDGYSNASAPTPYTMNTSFTPTADTAEPNDDTSTATPLGWNQEVIANILPLGDGDNYRVVADRRGQITVSFTQVPPGIEMNFRVLNSNGDQVSGWQGASASGGQFVGTMDIPSLGTYVIEVRDGYSNARSAVPYKMVASFNPTFDGAEPNDTTAEASSIPPDTQVWANILPLGDYDFYKITLAEQGELTVSFNQSPANIEMNFRVLDALGDQVWGWQGASASGELYESWADIKTPGDYYIQVADGYSNARSADAYGFNWTFIPTEDLSEPNDSVERATPISLGQPVSAQILPVGDGDLYQFSTSSDRLLVSFTESPANLDMNFRILNMSGDQVVGWSAAGNEGEVFSKEVELPAAGSYLLEMRDGYSNARSATPYRFVVSAR